MIDKIVPPDGKILFIAQRTKGFELSAASYATYGRVQEPIGGVFDFTGEDRTNLYQTVDPPPIDQLGAFIGDNHCAFLWVYKTDEYFTANAGDVLNAKIQENGFYRIVSTGGGQVQAQLLGFY